MEGTGNVVMDRATFCIGIVASAGGVEALSRVISTLPGDFPAAIAIVLHLRADRPSLLAQILGRKTGLSVRQARGGEILAPSTVLVAPPDRHLIVRADGTAALTEAPRDHSSRPSGNPLFASLARNYGPHAIAVVLTGYDGDGAAGLKLVKESGGVTIAQNEASSAHFSMPQAAIATGAVDRIIALGDIGPALRELVAPTILQR